VSGNQTRFKKETLDGEKRSCERKKGGRRASSWQDIQRGGQSTFINKAERSFDCERRGTNGREVDNMVKETHDFPQIVKRTEQTNAG